MEVDISTGLGDICTSREYLTPILYPIRRLTHLL